MTIPDPLQPLAVRLRASLLAALRAQAAAEDRPIVAVVRPAVTRELKLAKSEKGAK